MYVCVTRTIDIQRKKEEASAFIQSELGEKSVAFNQEREREREERGVRNDTGEVDGESAQATAQR